MNDQQAFIQWLHSRACWDLLVRCARTQGQGHCLLHGGEEPESLASELWEVICTRNGELQNRLTGFIAREDWNGLGRYLMSMARSLVNEKKRDKYYQRVRQVLSRAPDMGYQATPFCASYGDPDDNAVAIPGYDELLEQGFCPVYPSIKPESMKSAKTITALARDFHNQIAAHLQCRVRIPLRELCAHIRREYPRETDYQPFWQDLPGLDQDRESLDEALSRANPSGCRGLEYSDDWVTRCARSIALQLEDLDLLLVFCLKYYCGMTLKEMARILGLSGPSHATYRLSKVHHHLRFLLSLEDGLGKEDFDERLFARFQHRLLSSCKDEDCSRSLEQDGTTNKEPA